MRSFGRYPAQVTSPEWVAFLLGDLAVAVLDQIKPALKCYFPRLRAFAPLQYVDTAAVTTAQIHRKIPILRFYVVFTVKTWFNLVQNGYGIGSVVRASERMRTLLCRKMPAFSLVVTPRGAEFRQIPGGTSTDGGFHTTRGVDDIPPTANDIHGFTVMICHLRWIL